MIFTTNKYVNVKLVARIPRDYYVDKWKAAECRVFFTFQLVLLGMIFNDNLPIKRICHLLFHISRMLESPTILNDQDQVDLLYSYWVTFLRFTSALFGEDAIVFNFHSLLHFPEFAQRLGPITSLSCYPFENSNSFIGTNLHQKLHELVELGKRYHEKVECSFFEVSPFVK